MNSEVETREIAGSVEVVGKAPVSQGQLVEVVREAVISKGAGLRISRPDKSEDRIRQGV